MLIYGIIALVLLVLIIYFMRNSSLMQNVGGKKYAQKDDPDAQGIYDTNKNTDDAPRLTAQELLELSWKFLYDITEKVLYKFSDPDRKSVHECGKVMFQYGGKYNHVVDPAIAKTLGKRADIETQRRKNAPQVRRK